MSDGFVNAVVGALVNQSRRELASAYAEAAARPIGEVRLDIDFYSKADRDKPLDDYDFRDASGRHWQGTGARWCVCKVKWDGSQWKRGCRISGPLKYTPALDRLYEEASRLGLERVR